MHKPARILILICAALTACGGDGGGGGGGVSSSSSSAAATYTVGGGITGLTSQGLILINGTDSLTPNPGDTSFTFATAAAAGTSYAVTVQLQPDGLTCTVANGSGVIGTGNVTDVEVTCTATAFTVGGTISGLKGSGLVLANGADTVSPAPGATAFTFPTPVTTSSTFNVTVMTQPSGQTCNVTNGMGVILTSSVANVAVSCT